MRGWSGWNCHRAVVNKCDGPLCGPIMTFRPNGTTHIPASINVFHAIIWSQVQRPVTHQFQSTCAKSMESQWRRAENHASAPRPKKEKSLAETNKGWGGHTGSGVTWGVKDHRKVRWCGDETRRKHIIGEKEKQLHIIASVMGNLSGCLGRTTNGGEGNCTVREGGGGNERRCSKTPHLWMADMISAENAPDLDLTSSKGPWRCKQIVSWLPWLECKALQI